jgi:hemerythrin
MAVFVWNEKFSVGMETMDNQHKHFLNLLNNLGDEIQRKNSPEMVEMSINRLFNYAMIHFRDEEKILSTCGYPEIEQQRREHSFFVKQVKEMEASHQGGNLVRLESVVSFLRDWFINHIMTEDKEYASFISIYSPSERLFAAAG